jgi:hypothetical protein
VRFDGELKRRCLVNEIGREEATPMIRQHYIGKWPGVVTLILGLWRDCFLAGVIVFALPPPETAKRYGGFTWEFARLWVDDLMPRNTESWFIGRALAHIRKHYPQVEYLVTYADPSVGHRGTIYKATNWIADGMTDDERRSPRCDYEVNGKRYSRASHVPNGAAIKRVPRVSKHRFYMRLI